MTPGFVGRDAERAQLEAALARVAAGAGSLVLLGGEAGIGKTRLAEEVLRDADEIAFVRGAATPGCSPFGPVVGALRAFLRAEPDGLAECGPLSPHLALLLPELGPGRASDDRATLFEAVRCGLVAMVRRRPTAMLLDDLQWSDEATLELLARWARASTSCPCSWSPPTARTS